MACEQGKFKTATGSAPCQGPHALSPPPSDGMEKDDLQVTGVGVGGVGVESGDFLARLLGGIFGGAAGLFCFIIGAYWYFFQRQRHAATGIQIHGAQRMSGMTMTATFTRETELMPIEIKTELMMNPNTEEQKAKKELEQERRAFTEEKRKVREQLREEQTKQQQQSVKLNEKDLGQQGLEKHLRAELRRVREKEDNLRRQRQKLEHGQFARPEHWSPSPDPPNGL